MAQTEPQPTQAPQVAQTNVTQSRSETSKVTVISGRMPRSVSYAASYAR